MMDPPILNSRMYYGPSRAGQEAPGTGGGDPELRPRSHTFAEGNAKLRRELYRASHPQPSHPRLQPQGSDTSGWNIVNYNRMSEPLPPSLAFSALGRQHSTRNMHRHQVQDRDRLFNSDNVTMHSVEDDDHRSQVNFSGRMPGWLWEVLAAVLGIGSRRRRWRYAIATILHMLTVLSGLMFACCGLFFNIFDILSQLTTTTVLLGICKSVLGAYWLGMGIYAHALAARLFSNMRFVDCIRMHSKTVFKVSTIVIVMVFSVSVVGVNVYWMRHLLSKTEEAGVSNETRVRDGNCATANVNIVLCELYYIGRVVYSAFNLVWNLLVASILVSVCRTHTICIRRFMKELLYDTKIYEEFLMLQAFGPRVTLVEETIQPSDAPRRMATIMESNIWDDDINDSNPDSDEDESLPDNAQILQNMRSMRHGTFDASSANGAPLARPMQRFGGSQRFEYSTGGFTPTSWSAENNFPTEFFQNRADDEELLQDHSSPTTFFPFQYTTSTATAAAAAATASRRPSAESAGQHNNATRRRCSNSYSSTKDEPAPGKAASVTHQNGDTMPADQRQYEESGEQQPVDFTPALDEPEAMYQRALAEGKPPIMSNEDLLFTYFQLVRRLASTSRLLQRWMSTVITFVMMWCILLIIYWSSHSATWLGMFQFIMPLIVLFLLTSAYAEVNFEGDRLPKCLLPTQERTVILYYMKSVPLELKVFSFTLTYNAIVTVIAGVTVTFATRIILEQVGIR